MRRCPWGTDVENSFAEMEVWGRRRADIAFPAFLLPAGSPKPLSPGFQPPILSIAPRLLKLVRCIWHLVCVLRRGIRVFLQAMGLHTTGLIFLEDGQMDSGSSFKTV